jgi:protein tyrosine/serine phosphatase
MLCSTLLATQATKAMRSDLWAQPMKLEGVPNLHKITDNLYRSAQPNAEGMKNLKKMGVRTIVNLRSFNSDKDEVGNEDLARKHLYMKAWHPERKEVVQFLKIATDPKQGPVLFHCQHGADRTGTMCAMYRVVVQGWTKEEAIREMREGGYNFHEIWKNLPTWIQDIDVVSIRKELDLKSP